MSEQGKLTAAELRSRIFATDDRPLVPVTAWGLELFVRALSNDERAKIERATVENPGTKKQRVNTRYFQERIVVAATCDADGNAVFTEDDMKALAGKSAAEIGKLADKILELSGMRPQDVEDMVGN